MDHWIIEKQDAPEAPKAVIVEDYTRLLYQLRVLEGYSEYLIDRHEGFQIFLKHKTSGAIIIFTRATLHDTRRLEDMLSVVAT